MTYKSTRFGMIDDNAIENGMIVLMLDVDNELPLLVDRKFMNLLLDLEHENEAVEYCAVEAGKVKSDFSEFKVYQLIDDLRITQKKG